MVLRHKLLFPFLFLGVGLLLLTSCGGNVQLDTAKDENKEPMNTEEARNVFTLHCVSCHGVDGKLGVSDAADLSVSTLNDATIKTTILNGNDKGMMPYRDLLQPREVEGLVNFVKTLRTKE